MKKEIKLSGIVAIVVLSLFLIITGIKGFFKEKTDEEINTGSSENVEEQESETEDSASQEETPSDDVLIDAFYLASDETGAEGKVTFENIKSPFIYELHPEIKELLDPEKFNEALLAFITEKSLLEMVNHSVPDYSVKVKSFPYITRFLDGGNFYSFDFQIDIENRPILNVTFEPNSTKYVFTKL